MAKKKAAANVRTELSRHRRKKKQLIPPLTGLPNRQPTSWANDRLPEMLWAALLVTKFPRDQALERFMRIVEKAVEISRRLENGWKEQPLLVTLSGIASLPDNLRADLLSVIAEDQEAKDALRPLLLFESLPARGSWKAAIESQPDDIEDFFPVAVAVEACFWHQSQAATDCRWVKVIFSAVARPEPK
jgi:hypothetical protein